LYVTHFQFLQEVPPNNFLGVGPTLGAILASGFYKFIKVLEYETANPAQDTDGSNLRPQTAESMMEQGGRHGSKEWQQSHQHNLSNSMSKTSGSADGTNGTDVAAASGFVSPKPAMLRRPTQADNVRRESNVRMESPAMGTADDAFHGLVHGMHGEEEKRAIIT
jgi:aquaporin rerated protein, other eukaryote